MKHLFISYELAVIAKEKRFNEPCLFCHIGKPEYENPSNNFFFTTDDLSDNFDDIGRLGKNSDYKNSVCAPSFQELIDWFRNEHNIFIHVDPIRKIEKELLFSGHGDLITEDKFELNIFGRANVGYHKDYYEAFNKAIEEAFKLI